MTEWCNRPLGRIYPVVFIDAIHVKIRDGQVNNRTIFVAIGVTTAGERDILGLWAGEAGREPSSGSRCSLEINTRGTADVCIVVCDGLTGLPDAVAAVAASDYADVHHSSATQHFSLRAPQVLGPVVERHQARVHRPTEAAGKERNARVLD
jgi:transposase-like protein